MTLEIKNAEADKDKMLEEFRVRSEAHQRQLRENADPGSRVAEATHEAEVDTNAVPALKHTEEPRESGGWTKFEKPVLYF